MKKLLLLLMVAFCYNIVSAQQITAVQQWVQYYNGPDSLNDASSSIDVNGNIYVSGASQVPPFTPQIYKITTIKYSPSGVQQWVATYDSISNASFKSIAMKVDASSNVYVTGSVINNQFNLQTDIIVLKYDSTGTLLWTSMYAYPYGKSDEPKAIALDQAGNVYVTGFVSDTSTVSGSGISKEFVTLKFNSAGIQQWASHYSDNAKLDDISNDIAVDNSGNVYITGYSYNSINTRDIVTIKYNANGVQQWLIKYDGGGDDFANKLSLDISNNIYITGSSKYNTSEDYITIKYDNSGAQQWIAFYNGTGNGIDIAKDLAIDNNGQIIITGTSSGIGTDDNYVTVKYDSNGNPLWVATYNGTGNGADAANALSLDALDNIYITGQSAGLTTGNDYATVKYNTSGVQQWSIRFDGVASSSDVATDIKATANSDIYVTGYSYNGTDYDFATIKYSETTTVPLSVSVTTNDATCNGASNGTAGAMASGGNSPYSYLWSNGQTTQNITGLAAGYYTITVTDSISATVTSTTFISEPPIDTISNPAPCSELFISEYVEGSTHNTALEFYNPSENPIILNRYFVRVFMNGAPTPLITQLAGTVMPKQTHVISNPNASSSILNKANQTSNKVNFNGDDAIQLIKVLNNININIDSIEGLGQNPHDILDTLQLDILDQIGLPEVTPGNGSWAVGNNGSTKNSTLIRNFGVSSGLSDWGCGQMQWSTLQQDDVSNLGSHINKCTKPYIIDGSGDSLWNANELIIRFDTSAIIKTNINKVGFVTGSLSDFVNSQVIQQMTIKCDFDCSSLLTFKIFHNMTTADSLSITRIGDTIHVPEFWATLSVMIPANFNEQTIADSLETLFPIIKYAERNYIGTIHSLPNDPLLLSYQQTGLTSQSFGINIEPAWNKESGRDNILIGVFDTGINYRHEDFGDGTYSGSKIKGGWDYINGVHVSNSTTPDDNGHGTATSGIIGALKNNGKGIAGIAGGDMDYLNTGCSLYSFKIANSAGNILTTHAVDAIYAGSTSSQYALNILSNSWGLSDSKTLREATQFASNNKVTMVVSSGNDFSNVATYPASYQDDWVIKVGANDVTGDRADFSNYGYKLDFIAPGTKDLYAAPNHNNNSGYSYNEDGTSFSCPIVSGVSGLILSYVNNNPYAPNLLAPEDVENILENYTYDLQTGGYDQFTGWGRINAGNSFDHLILPAYKIRHFQQNVYTSSAQLFSSGQTVQFPEGVPGLATGYYLGVTDIYKLTVTFNFSIPATETVLDAWVRNSSSNSYGYTHVILNPHFSDITLESFNQNTVVLSGYLYKSKVYNIIGQYVYDRWFPTSLSGSRTFAFSLHTYDPTVGIEDNTDANFEFNIFPNPTKNNLNLELTLSEYSKISISIFDIQGRLLKDEITDKLFSGTNTFKLDVADLKQGIYFIQVKSNFGISTKKFTKL